MRYLLASGGALAAVGLAAGCLLVTPVGELDDRYQADAAGGRPRAQGQVELCEPVAADAGSWVLAPDSARVSNYVRLTPAENGALGALWWSTPLTLDELELSFEFRISPAWDGTSGIGFAFAWTALQLPPAQNAAFEAYGLPQARGWALAFDSRPPQDPPNKPSFKLIDGSRSALANNDGIAGAVAITVVADAIVDDPSFWHPVKLRLRPDAAEIYFRDALLTDPAIRDYQGFQGVWGFTASTSPAGPLSEFSIRNVRVFAPYDGGCVR
jgi:Legume-like lectin family